MSEAVAQTKAEFTRAKSRLEKGLKSTPADKLNWSPSPTSRTAVQLVAHSAMSTSGLARIIKGEGMPFSSMAELDAALRSAEQQYTSADETLALLEATSAEYLGWLDTLTDEDLATIVNLPMGAMPLAVAITFPGAHLVCHASQLDYLQTVWGDHEWRF